MRIVRSKLFGAGLVPVDTAELVKRYNDCLAELGIAPTSLPSFAVDGIGWSPEVAREKGDMLYLSAGIANPMGIIITANQRNKPIYFPFNSYDRAMMDQYYARYKGEIADITTTRGICLSIDQELTTYERPGDLRLVEYIIVRSSSGTLGTEARRQQSLVNTLLTSDLGWTDAGLRQEIAQSAADFGDLRFRRVEIPDFRFDDLRTFSTRAFGGVFVIQTLDQKCKLLLLEDESHVREDSWKSDIHALRSPTTIDLLVKERLLEINIPWYQAYPQVLAALKEGLTAEIICAADPAVHYGELNSMQKKQRLAELGSKVWDVYHELERLILRLHSTSIPAADDLSRDLRLILLRPNRTLPFAEQQVLRQVLHRVTPTDLVQMYADDKNLFIERYQGWPKSKQEWAVERVYQDYLVEGA